jgi:hypothetical protein
LREERGPQSSEVWEGWAVGAGEGNRRDAVGGRRQEGEERIGETLWEGGDGRDRRDAAVGRKREGGDGRDALGGTRREGGIGWRRYRKEETGGSRG